MRLKHQSTLYSEDNQTDISEPSPALLDSQVRPSVERACDPDGRPPLRPIFHRFYMAQQFCPRAHSTPGAAMRAILSPHMVIMCWRAPPVGLRNTDVSGLASNTLAMSVSQGTAFPREKHTVKFPEGSVPIAKIRSGPLHTPSSLW